ncbi:MAG: hypothetical protein FJX46_03035 [Alphaproteobacteria bacterium]|nr:hypothetical protein [Alphaproteobacteria bacterium]
MTEKPVAVGDRYLEGNRAATIWTVTQLQRGRDGRVLAVIVPNHDPRARKMVPVTELGNRDKYRRVTLMN